MDKEEAKLMKLSRYSYGMVIPKDFIKKLKWKERQKIIVALKGKSLRYMLLAIV